MTKNRKREDYKLTIELVPKNAWHSNLRNKLGRNWDKIRKKAYKDAGYKCEICGAKGRLECHEIWKYDDEKHIQTLKSFMALCSNCHNIKHIGLSQIRARRGELNFQDLVIHFCEVNKVSSLVFDSEVELAFRIWKHRSEHTWKTDLGKWEKLINRRPGQ